MDGFGVAQRSHEAYQQALGESWFRLGQQAQLLFRLSLHHAEAISNNQWRVAGRTLSALYGLAPLFARPNAADALPSYLQDYAQRWILFLDTLRRRGDACIEREKEGFKPALAFDYELLVDGRKLERPVNYALVRIEPPPGSPQPGRDRRPWVIIDPRAGHGSGIGGFKSESEVGVAINDGHPVYFVIFYPDPEPGQTLADVCAAEAVFLKEIRSRHPNSPRPIVTGNCQGGWATMILAATHPGLTGPIIIAGAPLSYWAGEVGRNPFRYLGGIAGGTVPAMLISDLGGGRFDGATLVMNFEALNPGKTWWRKNFDLFSNVDVEAERYLEFEKWWSGFYFMNEAEIRWIVENLFVGNKLTRGQALLSDGTPIDLTRIDAPIVVFASHGDNITPPQQALNWIADLYASVKEIQARGHVIVYTLHDSIGHLGIFVSAQVAGKHHKQITSVVKTIESLAPGLYEMLIEQEGEIFTVSFESRSIDDILALGGDREEEVSFAAVAEYSEWATKTYELTLRPLIQTFITPDLAALQKQMHPMRQQYYLLSEKHNPWLAGVGDLAERVRQSRIPAAKDNPVLLLEQLYGDFVEQGWNFYRDTRDAMLELTFHALFGTPWMARVGAAAYPQAEFHDIGQFPEVQDAITKAKAGGYSEAIVRMIILLDRARGSVTRERLERWNNLLKVRAPFDTMQSERLSHLIHQQNVIVEFAGDEAIATLPVLLKDEVDRIRAVNLVLDIAGPVERMDAATIVMFKRLQAKLMTLALNWREPTYLAAQDVDKRTRPNGGADVVDGTGSPSRHTAATSIR